MNWPQKIVLVGAVIGEVIGFLFAGVGLYFLAQYFIDVESELRHEYLFGVFLGFMYAAGVLLVVAVSVGFIRRNIPRPIFRLVAWPSTAVGVGLVVLYFGYLGFAFIQSRI